MQVNCAIVGSWYLGEFVLEWPIGLNKNPLTECVTAVGFAIFMYMLKLCITEAAVV